MEPKLEWNVLYYDINRNKITTYNVFNHYRFSKYIEEAFEKCKTKKEFAEILRRELMYYFCSKAEWELVIELDEDNHIFLIPWCGCRNPEEIKIDVTNNTRFDWNGFAKKHIKRQIYKNEAKVDVYNQIEYVWDNFLEYVWNSKKKD